MSEAWVRLNPGSFFAIPFAMEFTKGPQFDTVGHLRYHLEPMGSEDKAMTVNGDTTNTTASRLLWFFDLCLSPGANCPLDKIASPHPYDFLNGHNTESSQKLGVERLLAVGRVACQQPAPPGLLRRYTVSMNDIRTFVRRVE